MSFGRNYIMRNLVKSIAAGAIITLAIAGCRHNITIASKPAQAPETPAAAPVASITVTPATVERGQSAQLSWNTNNASTVAIDGIGPVDPSGSRAHKAHQAHPPPLLPNSN